MLETYVLDMLFDLYQDDGFGNRLVCSGVTAIEAGNIFIYSDPYIDSDCLYYEGY